MPDDEDGDLRCAAELDEIGRSTDAAAVLGPHVGLLVHDATRYQPVDRAGDARGRQVERDRELSARRPTALFQHTDDLIAEPVAMRGHGDILGIIDGIS
ncbi:hypothetical protein GCM10023087_02940 [Microbacterium rhizosphaerae]